MEKGIYGLAFLEYNFEHGHRDIIDAYIPLVCNCLIELQTNKAEVGNVRKKLEEKYGLKKITDGAILSIFARMAKDKYGMLHAKAGEYKIDGQKVGEMVSKQPKEDLISGFDIMAAKIEGYSQRYKISVTRERIEKGIYDFMDQYDVYLTLGNIRELCARLSRYKKNEKQLKYIISKYLIEAIDKDPEAIALMVKLAKGHALSSLICLQNLSNMTGSLKDVEIYLDAPIIYNLLNLNDQANYHLAIELMQNLKDNGAKFCIFEHNYNEVVSTMTDARDRLFTGDYDLRKSSRLLKTAHREHLSSIQISMKINEFSELLERWKVKTKGRPSLQDGGKDIDVATLSEIIKNAYTQKRTRSLFWNELNMLEIDVNSITYIYRLRGNVVGTNLKNSKALLLSTNRVISTASHDNRINTLHHAIPACSTDVFLSTILWTNYPGSNNDLNQKLLMSECYNSIEIDDRLMLRYYDEVKKKYNSGAISEAQYLQATTTHVALDLLADKTLNDINAYTDRTTDEVMEILQHEHREELEALAAVKDKERAEIEEKAAQKQAEDKKTIERLNAHIVTHDKNIQKTSEAFAKWITGIIGLLLMVLFAIAKLYPKPSEAPLWWVIIYWLIVSLVTFWAVLSWSGCIPAKSRIYQWIYNLLYKKMSEKLNEE